MKFLKSILTGESPKLPELEEPDLKAFDAAIAAIDKAAAERAKQPELQPQRQERREGDADRRTGLPDSRPTGSPERRSGLKRRSGLERRGGADRRSPAQPGFGKRGA